MIARIGGRRGVAGGPLAAHHRTECGRGSWGVRKAHSMFTPVGLQDSGLPSGCPPAAPQLRPGRGPSLGLPRGRRVVRRTGPPACCLLQSPAFRPLASALATSSLVPAHPSRALGPLLAAIAAVCNGSSIYAGAGYFGQPIFRTSYSAPISPLNAYPGALQAYAAGAPFSAGPLAAAAPLAAAPLPAAPLPTTPLATPFAATFAVENAVGPVSTQYHNQVTDRFGQLFVCNSDTVDWVLFVKSRATVSYRAS